MRMASGVLLGVLVIVGPASAQGAGESRPQGPMTPRPAHERLAVFEGVWTSADTIPGVSFRETCSWMEGGRRHMICRSRYESPNGNVEHRTIYSYRGRDSTYVVTALLGTGQVWTYEGRVQDGRWVFDRVFDRPDVTQRLRMVVTPAGDTIHFIEESSENGAAWKVTEDYRYVRIRDQSRMRAGGADVSGPGGR